MKSNFKLFPRSRAWPLRAPGHIGTAAAGGGGEVTHDHVSVSDRHSRLPTRPPSRPRVVRSDSPNDLQAATSAKGKKSRAKVNRPATPTSPQETRAGKGRSSERLELSRDVSFLSPDHRFETAFGRPLAWVGGILAAAYSSERLNMACAVVF